MDDPLARAALEYHRYPRPGKIAVLPTKGMTNQRDLALAYSPGVAVIEGAFELKIREADGQETVHRIEAGGHFGERVLLGEGLRTGTVRALEDSSVLFIEGEDFRRLVRALPPLDDYFHECVSHRFPPLEASPHPAPAAGARPKIRPARTPMKPENEIAVPTARGNGEG
jgi:CRP-like cAMP-binding protein